MKSTPLRSLAVSVCICLIGGCSSEVKRYAVSGSVAIDGVPAGLTTVRFFSSTGAEQGGTGRTDGGGKFSLGEDGKNTGLPAGEYKVTFSQTVVGGRPFLGGSGGKKSEQVAGEKENIPDAYRDPKTTPVTAVVGKDSTTFTFDIKKK